MEATPPDAHDCARIHALAALLADDAIDAALEAGLMEVLPDRQCTACADDARLVLAMQQRLRDQWAARERHRARTARLARRAAERQARRAPAPPPATDKTAAAPALPPAVAAALARAKARAAGQASS